MKKFTAASAKSFIRKNRSILKIKVISSFDGMTDCVEQNYGAQFKPVQAATYSHENNLGIKGVWFVGGSRNSFIPYYEGDQLVGFECYNCCGTWEVRV